MHGAVRMVQNMRGFWQKEISAHNWPLDSTLLYELYMTDEASDVNKANNIKTKAIDIK